MLKQLIFVWVATAVALAVAAALIPSVDIDGGVGTLLWVALLFGLVINGALLALTAGLSDALDVGGFLATIVAAVIISVVTTLLGFAGLRLFEGPSVQEA